MEQLMLKVHLSPLIVDADATTLHTQQHYEQKLKRRGADWRVDRQTDRHSPLHQTTDTDTRYHTPCTAPHPSLTFHPPYQSPMIYIERLVPVIGSLKRPF